MQIPMSRNKSNQPTYGYDEYKTCVTLWNYIEWSIYNIYIFIIYYSTWDECIYNMYNMGCYRVYWTYLRPVYFSAYTVSAHWFLLVHIEHASLVVIVRVFRFLDLVCAFSQCFLVFFVGVWIILAVLLACCFCSFYWSFLFAQSIISIFVYFCLTSSIYTSCVS